MITRMFVVSVLAASVASCANKPSDSVSLTATSQSGFGVELRDVSAIFDGNSVQTVGYVKRAYQFGFIDAHLHLELLDARGNVLGKPIEKRLPSMRKHRGWEPKMRFSWNDEVQAPLSTAARVTVKPGAVGHD